MSVRFLITVPRDRNGTFEPDHRPETATPELKCAKTGHEPVISTFVQERA
jgi:hypothetical protein